MTTLLDSVINQAARTAHEVNRAWCAINGDNSQVPYDETPIHTKESVKDGIKAILEGRITKPSDSWENWKAFKEAEGWTYGEKKDFDAKTHPNIIENYEDLPAAERHKDVLYFAVVMSFIN